MNYGKELSCPPGVRSCYECLRPASECPQEKVHECAFCRELVDEFYIDQYVSWIGGKEVVQWVCDACYDCGVFNEIEEEAVAV